MTDNIRSAVSILIVFTGLAVTAAQAANPAGRPKAAGKTTKTLAPKPTEPEPATVPVATVVSYSAKDLVPVKTRLRYTTLIILPEDERILDFTCGDKEFWVVDGNENLAYVKPAKAGAKTNLNLITASGNIYSFVLTEISEQPGSQPDLKVFIELREGRLRHAAGSAPRFVSAEEVKDYQQQVELAKDEARQARQSAQASIDEGINRFIRNVRFPYRFEAGKKPFYVRAMYHDHRFTYIQARPEETPTLFEIKDGKPNLVNFDYENGVYVVRKILDRGYLVIGKQKLAFRSGE